MRSNFEKFKLSEDILKAIGELGYKKPSDVQEKVIPEIMFNKDVIVKSQTGSGKTAAFGIPLCEKIEWNENKPQVLILTPTRELAVQIKDDLLNIGRFKRLKTIAVFGKQPFSEQAAALKQRTHIVAGTPGRVLDHIDRGTLDLSKIKYFVIDEADEMLNMGFIGQVEGVIRRIPKNRVTMLFSATIPEEIESLCKNHMRRPVKIEIKAQKLITDNIEHNLYRVDDKEKLEALNKILVGEVPKTTIVFCRTKDNVDLTYDYLNKKGYSIGKIHGGMLQKERLEVMEAFRRGDFRILIATDIAARGIDIEGITHVININVPMEKEAYVHRIGRTGRAGSKGKAITFATQYEDRFLNDIFDYIGFSIEESLMEEISKEEIEKSVKVLTSKPKAKNVKSKSVNKGITKIYLNGGKKKKIRAVDIVGAVSRIEGVNGDDIGIIDIQDMGSYVEILNGKGNLVMTALKDSTIKGKKLRVEKARK